MKDILVNTPSGNYKILIQSGILKQLPTLLSTYNNKIAIVTNTTIVPLYGNLLTNLLKNSVVIALPDGEKYKNLASVHTLYKEFAANGIDRESTVIALGGGVIGDSAGFAAATYMRGIQLIQIPTTLLAMVDASVGGKVGVDLPQGKNLVGSFKQPNMVIMDPQTLASLPKQEWQCGMAEVIKHGLLQDASLLDLSLSKKDMVQFIFRAVKVKVDIVEKDPFEKNIRAYLNLGHTFAHAIEKVAQYNVRHGEAVAIGLIAATRLSHRLGLCTENLSKQVEKLIEEIGLPKKADICAQEMHKAMALDKKWKNGRSRFVLLHDIGKPTIVEDISKEDILAVCRSVVRKA